MNPTDFLGEQTLGARIVHAREALGLTTPQVARRLGVRTETMAGWESDRSVPRSNRLQLLAGVLGVSLGWLLTGSGEAPATSRAEDDDAPPLGDALAEIREDAARLVERINTLIEDHGKSERVSAS